MWNQHPGEAFPTSSNDGMLSEAPVPHTAGRASEEHNRKGERLREQVTCSNRKWLSLSKQTLPSRLSWQYASEHWRRSTLVSIFKMVADQLRRMSWWRLRLSDMPAWSRVAFINVRKGQKNSSIRDCRGRMMSALSELENMSHGELSKQCHHLNSSEAHLVNLPDPWGAFRELILAEYNGHAAEPLPVIFTDGTNKRAAGVQE